MLSCMQGARGAAGPRKGQKSTHIIQSPLTRTFFRPVDADIRRNERTFGESPFRCDRTRENILSQSLYFACINGTHLAAYLRSVGAVATAF